VAITAFASLVQDYLVAHALMDPADTGRMVALMGDAELDEGNIYECLIEAAKHDIRNCWWIVDYNRQSLDATTADRMFRRFDEIFVACGWRVVTLKYGKLMEAAFAEAGGEALKAWIDDAPNADYAALTYLGGAAWRERLLREAPDTKPLLDARDDEAVAALMTNLAGHDLASLTEAFDGGQDDSPHLLHRLHHQGLRPALRRPQGQPRRPHEPRPGRRFARADGRRGRGGVGAVGRPRRQ
jgi:pyruvate dehydrogenase E1 component